MENELRKPDSSKYSDWNCAWNYALREEAPAVRHLAACFFGENAGPDWAWIFQTEDMKWAWLKANCDYTGWCCRSEGEWKGGFNSAEDAVKDMNYESDNLLAQIKGEKPYALN